MKKFFTLLFVLLSFIFFASHYREPSDRQKIIKHLTRQKSVFTVATSNYPLYYFSQRICAEHCKTIFPIPQGSDPATAILSLNEIRSFQSADLIVINGAEYESWMQTTALSASKILDSTLSLQENFLKAAKTTTHSHGPAGKHDHGQIDPYLWLDPLFALAQAGTITMRLSAALPAHKEHFERNFNVLKTDLTALHHAFAETFSNSPQIEYFASHPLYNYFAARYKIPLQSMHWEPNIFPTPAEWEFLAKSIKSKNRVLMFWEGEPNVAILAKLSALKITPVVFNPLFTTPAQGDYLSVMQVNLQNLQKCQKI